MATFTICSATPTPCTLIYPDGEVVLETVVKGELLAKSWTTSSSTARPISRLQSAVEQAVREAPDYEEAGRFVKFYEDGLNGYTYLEKLKD